MKLCIGRILFLSKTLFIVSFAALLAFILLDCGTQPTGANPPLAGFVVPQDSINLNPSKFAPLSAIIRYSSPVKGKTKIIIKGKHGSGSDIQQLFGDYGISHAVPVIGLYANYANTVLVVVVDSNNIDLAQASVTITTPALSNGIPSAITVSTAATDQMENGLDLVSSLGNSSPNIPYMVDRDGEIRWVLDYSSDSTLHTLSYDCGIARLSNGNFYFGDIATHCIYEVDLFGRIAGRWPLTGYSFHHNVQEKPDGNFLATVSKTGSIGILGGPTIEDYVVEVDRTTGAVVHELDLKQSLDEYRTALGTDSVASDWFHGNALIPDPSDNTIIVSGRTQGVVKLTYENQVKWILAPHKGWNANGRGQDLRQFLLTPLDASGNPIADTAVKEGYANHPDFEWNWFQHSTVLMPNGDLLLFDNGSSRNFNFTDTAIQYSRAVEYRINPAAMTVQQMWAYGKDRKKETFSLVISSVQYLPATNHILFCPGYKVPNTAGNGGKIVEIDYATKAVVFEEYISTATGEAFHRAKRTSLYP
jgi:arylsulfate sulfotransferase